MHFLSTIPISLEEMTAGGPPQIHNDPITVHSNILTNGQQTQVNGTSSSTHMPDPSWYNGVGEMLAGPSKWTESYEKSLTNPYDYLDTNPGHGARSKLIQTLDRWLHVPTEKLILIDKAIRMLHTSSLMIDDIEDGSELRRGRPSSHMVFGTALTINSANYIYFLAMNEVLIMSDLKIANQEEDRKPPLMNTEQVQKMLVEEMMNLHRGQGMDLYWRENFICPSEQEYIMMVNNKTGGLFRIALKLLIGQSLTLKSIKEGESLIPLINLIGLEYQIRDDYMNLRSGDYTQNKGYCDDLSEGKFSFPIIHAIFVGRAEQQAEREGQLLSGDKSNSDPIGNDSIQSTLAQASVRLTHQASSIETERLARQEESLKRMRRMQDRNKFQTNGIVRDSSQSPVYDSPLEPASPSEEALKGDYDLPKEDELDNGKSVKIENFEDFLNALKERPKEAMKKRAIVEFMQNKTNSFHYTCQVLLNVDRQVRKELRKIENLLDDGKPNNQLRAYVNLLRSGWHGSSDCPPIPASGKDTPYEDM